MVDGLKRQTTVKVDLSEFFEVPTAVWVKKFNPYCRAQLREVLMEGVRVDSVEMEAGSKKKGKVSAVPMSQGMAGREMKARDLRLEYGVQTHTITSGGAPAVWNADLWKELDEAEPAILAKVLEGIDELNTVAGAEGEGDPTSATTP